jgi:hypothetical protein
VLKTVVVVLLPEPGQALYRLCSVRGRTSDVRLEGRGAGAFPYEAGRYPRHLKLFPSRVELAGPSA